MRAIQALQMRTPVVGSSIALRSTSLAQNSGSSTLVVSFPAGAAVDDTVVLFVGGGDQVMPVGLATGWTKLQDNFATATGWNCAVYRKALTAGDISTGSVTITKNPAGGGTYQMDAVMFCFVGRAAVKDSKIVSSLTSGSVNGQAFSFASSLAAGDIVLAADTGRGNSATISITPGTLQQRHNATNGSMAGYSYPMPSAGSGSFTPANIVSAYEYVFMMVGMGTIPLPSFSVSPSITSANGFYAEGDTLTGVPGTHNGTSSTYKWTRDGTDISGATSASYTLVSADVGHVVRFVEVAENEMGRTDGASSPTATVGTPTYGTVGNRKTSDGNDRLTSTGVTRVITARTA